MAAGCQAGTVFFHWIGAKRSPQQFHDERWCDLFSMVRSYPTTPKSRFI
jgi:hypothetical protein